MRPNLFEVKIESERNPKRDMVISSMWLLMDILHMQVDVCFLRSGRGRHYNGLPMYRKNIIAFPQELAEVKQMLFFWTNVRVGDVVNVEPDHADEPVQRCRVTAVLPAGFAVERPDGTAADVPLERVRQRVVLPWKPEDLRDHSTAREKNSHTHTLAHIHSVLSKRH